MKKVLIFVIILLITSCAASKNMLIIIPQDTLDEIPMNTTKVIVTNDQSLIENYNKSYQVLLINDYRIENDNKEMGYISASKMDIGDTNVRLNVVCNNNQIAVTSEWKAGTNSEIWATAVSGIPVDSDWNNAVWTKQYNKPNVAFAKAVQFAKEMGTKISYITPEKKPIDKNGDPLYN